MTVNPAEIRTLLTTLLRGTCSAGELRDFANICHRFASAYLRLSSTRTHFAVDSLGISVDQLAFDAIAELFGRDQNGRYAQLERYFAACGPLQNLSDDELVACLRRLIFSAVKNHRYRVFQECDPARGRIARNIKLMLKNHPRLELTERHGLPAVALRSCPKSREGRAELPQELLLPDVFAAGAHGGNLRTMLDTLADILHDQHAYAGMLPLAQVCELVQTVHATFRKNEPDAAAGESIADWELRSLIAGVVRTIAADQLSTYRRKGKISEREARSYRKSVSDILERTFCASEEDEEPYYAVFARHMAGVTNELYRRKHRPVLEYLVKKAKSAMRAKLKKEWGIPQGRRYATRRGGGSTDE